MNDQFKDKNLMMRMKNIFVDEYKHSIDRFLTASHPIKSILNIVFERNKILLPDSSREIIVFQTIPDTQLITIHANINYINFRLS